MAVVTALLPAPGRRFAIHVDGRCFCTVSDALVARWRLHEGRQLGDEDLARLQADAAVDAAVAQALPLLERRLRSRAEVAAALRRKGHNDEAVSGALAHLSAVGLLDDADFARRYVADKRALAGWGEVRIRQGLRALGITPDDAERALAAGRDAAGGAADGDAEVARATDLLRRKGAPQGPPEAAQRRAYQLLLRKGYPAAVAYPAVRAWCAAPDEDLS